MKTLENFWFWWILWFGVESGKWWRTWHRFQGEIPPKRPVFAIKWGILGTTTNSGRIRKISGKTMVPEFTCGKTILPVPRCSRGLCPSITSKTRQNYASNRGKTIGKVTHTCDSTHSSAALENMGSSHPARVYRSRGNCFRFTLTKQQTQYHWLNTMLSILSI